MGIFSGSEKSFLGVDLGAGNIKLVELRDEQGRPRLGTYGLYEVAHEHVIDNDWSHRRVEATQALKMLLAQSKAQSNLVISALPTFAVFSSLISIPAVSNKELPNAIRLEAKKVIPRPIEEMILDWKEVQRPTDEQAVNSSEQENDTGGLGRISGLKPAEQRKVLITAAPKELVDAYMAIFKDAGLRLVSLETEGLALSRSLIGKDPSVVMVVDMGAQTTNVSVIEQGIPLVNRAVNLGGATLTKEMSKRMAVDPKQAEQWKRDFGVLQTQSSLSPAMKELLDDVLHETEYLFQLYRRQFSFGSTSGGAIEKIVLAGGSSFVPGLAQHLAQRLNVPVHLGDPWARIVYPEDLSSVLAEIGPAMAVSVGLAMRHIIK